MDLASISYLYRRGARYHYRRRLYLRKIINRPITVPLATADPVEARRLVTRLSAKWEVMAVKMFDRASRGFLKAAELESIFRAGLDEELGLAMGPYLDSGMLTAIDQRPLRVLEATYRIAARPPADAECAPSDLIDEMTADFSTEDRRAVVLMLKSLAPHKAAYRDAEHVLAQLSAPLTARTIGDARTQILLARAEAQARASFAGHPLAIRQGDPFSALLDDDVVAAIRRGPGERQMRTDAADIAGNEPQTPPAPADSPFLTQDTRRFSEIIEPTIALIRHSGDWNADMNQRRRVIQSFAWISGDKRLCDYRPADAQEFAETLRGLPVEFRWGSPDAGAMSRPLADVLAEVATMAVKTDRSNRTYNRDLTIMARFSRELAKTSWRPRSGKDLVVDFNEYTASIEENPEEPDRMPWTEEQLLSAFSSPIYTGGGKCSRRFKTGPHNKVWHDAAYWVPLILAYMFLSREEACGLECDELIFDIDIPFLVIRSNMTRSKDGKKPAGLKRPSRYRALPIHPELLRLGLSEYVKAIKAQGHRMLFPELYQDHHANRGGKRFYACAGRYILDHVDGITPLLRTSSGKRADLHSMRTAGGSALEFSEAKQIHVDDIMGHAREGTGPRKYSRAWFFKGGEAILAKRLHLMSEAMPNVTAHLQPAPIACLPLEERSRTGSSVGCASRRKV